MIALIAAVWMTVIIGMILPYHILQVEYATFAGRTVAL